ncbi:MULTISPECIES: hypothetical protein [Fischerella]|uniref:Uncharacterized protein n=1 Tax=Fischerella muscicola CCMEE 5323 TaxID=2019572 RepID=A0A2N6K4R7_FISMU|nr:MULTISPECIES: hypothetical protein [Fischerella]MBD2431324.1 hypothetical protein [Fischerella sp. FACHB-380]PLZ91260.1 hypothetical protein CEN44_08910 [Fischerella muscicola CCMEE 5323]
MASSLLEQPSLSLNILRVSASPRQPRPVNFGLVEYWNFFCCWFAPQILRVGQKYNRLNFYLIMKQLQFHRP